MCVYMYVCVRDVCVHVCVYVHVCVRVSLLSWPDSHLDAFMCTHRVAQVKCHNRPEACATYSTYIAPQTSHSRPTHNHGLCSHVLGVERLPPQTVFCAYFVCATVVRNSNIVFHTHTHVHGISLILLLTTYVHAHVLYKEIVTLFCSGKTIQSGRSLAAL